MMRFGSTVTLNSAVVYVGYNLEKVLLGRFWGADAIGLYGRAYQLINIPTENLNSAVGGVAFSALSRVQNDPVRFRSYFLTGYSLVLSLTVPTAFACFLFADDLIPVVLGAKWTEAIPIFRALAPTSLVLAMINPMVWVLISLGMVNRSLKIGMVLAPIVLIGYLIGVPWGPQGVALGYSGAMLLFAIPHIAWCVHGTSISLKDLMVVIGQPIVSATVAGAAAVGVQYWMGDTFSILPRLLIESAVLGVTYLVIFLYVFGQKALYTTIRSGLGRSTDPEPSPVPADVA